MIRNAVKRYVYNIDNIIAKSKKECKMLKYRYMQANIDKPSIKFSRNLSLNAEICIEYSDKPFINGKPFYDLCEDKCVLGEKHGN